jgi:tRNA 2-thiouridine synthesizing protein E
MALNSSIGSQGSKQAAVSHGLAVNGKVIAVDSEGYLLDSADWEPAVAEVMAREDGLTLGEAHWEVIRFLHQFYERYEVAPELSVLTRTLCREKNDCKWNRRFLTELFPAGAAKMACRYAGLPKPAVGACV